MTSVRFILVILFVFFFHAAFLQDLYTARGYWEERNKETFKNLKQKKLRNGILTENERLYLTDYEDYLLKYYQRMSAEEQEKYLLMKPTWDEALILTKDSTKLPAAPRENQKFSWRSEDHFNNGLYGLYYGITLIGITGTESSFAAGLPLITAGAWQLGPVLNPKKYEGINASTMRAAGGGKILGLGYGLALGFALAGNSSDNANLVLGLSTVGSIGMGELAFQIQKRRRYSDGYVELMRHYGFLGPAVGLLTVISTGNDNANAAGASALVGGIAGLYFGSIAAKKYDYTLGDVYAIRSLAWINAGVGFALAGQAAEGSDKGNRELFLLPAVTTVTGTILGQRMVKGVNLTTRQGSTLNLAAGGAALIALGVVTALKEESIGVVVGVPSAFALIAHQLVFHKYKIKNRQAKIDLGFLSKPSTYFSLRITPENYFANLKQDPAHLVVVEGKPVLSKPMVTFNFTF